MPLAEGKVSIGEAVSRFRKDVTGLRQDQFARMCKISLRALRQIEHDEGSLKLQTLSSIFHLLGMQIGVIKGVKY